jgi:ABC-type uncharacterized transport system permease subunit
MISMYSGLIGVTAILAYLAASGVMVLSLRQDFTATEAITQRRLPVLSLGWAAAVLHACAVAGYLSVAGALNLGFLNALSLVTLLIVIILLFASLAKPVDKLGIVIFPLSAAVLMLQMSFPVEVHSPKDYAWPIRIHIFVSILAYSFLNIAAIQAILLALQDWGLRRHHLGRLSRTLPPLQTMESMLFQLIAAGLLLLTVSLVSGFLFLDDLFAQHLAHKTVLSIAAWIVFTILMWGRMVHGWRGRTAIRWTLGGFIALMLGYFGSKMVLELILHRV